MSYMVKSTSCNKTRKNEMVKKIDEAAEGREEAGTQTETKTETERVRVKVYVIVLGRGQTQPSRGDGELVHARVGRQE